MQCIFLASKKRWGLPLEAPLTNKAAERLSREAAERPFAQAARNLNEDWDTALDAKQIQRWSIKLGTRLIEDREQALLNFERGQLPKVPENKSELLVIGIDGGRVQMKDKQPNADSRWREDKVVTVTSYLTGRGPEDKPQALVTTHAATLDSCLNFGRIARFEAEKRGLNRSQEVIFIADAGNWIDPLIDREFHGITRIVDWYHAVERLKDCAKALFANQATLETWYAKLKALLWQGKVTKVVQELKEALTKVWNQEKGIPKNHPLNFVAQSIGYFDRHKDHMRYRYYRDRGWPIGSGNVEAGVKQFNKRVKGTEQFWTEEGLEAILQLRALRISQDNRWEDYWRQRTAYKAA